MHTLFPIMTSSRLSIHAFSPSHTWFPNVSFQGNFMFTLNGIVYASEKPENIQILSAKPLDDMMMLLTFSTGEQRLFDATILNGPAFAPLSDEKIFKDCKIVDGVVTWMDEDIDCAPEYMYEHSYAYPSFKSAI